MTEFQWITLIVRLAMALAQTESAGDPQADNQRGAGGMFQQKECFVERCNEVLGRAGSGYRFTMEDRMDPDSAAFMTILWLMAEHAAHPEWGAYELALAFRVGPSAIDTAEEPEIDYAQRVVNLVMEGAM